jgi:hypothetical protein
MGTEVCARPGELFIAAEKKTKEFACMTELFYGFSGINIGREVRSPPVRDQFPRVARAV